MQHFKLLVELISKNEYAELREDLQMKLHDIPKGGMLPQCAGEHRLIVVLCAGNAHGVGYSSEGREVEYLLYKPWDVIGGFTLCKSEHSVFADSACTVMTFSYEKLLTSTHALSRDFLIALLEALSIKYAELQKRTRCLTCSTLREKIFTYLSDLSTEKEWFEVPLDRNALAAYLFCDRSALCRELSKMKKDGIITFRKNRFCILLSRIPKSD